MSPWGEARITQAPASGHQPGPAAAPPGTVGRGSRSGCGRFGKRRGSLKVSFLRREGCHPQGGKTPVRPARLLLRVADEIEPQPQPCPRPALPGQDTTTNPSPSPPGVNRGELRGPPRLPALPGEPGRNFRHGEVGGGRSVPGAGPGRARRSRGQSTARRRAPGRGGAHRQSAPGRTAGAKRGYPAGAPGRTGRRTERRTGVPREMHRVSLGDRTGRRTGARRRRGRGGHRSSPAREWVGSGGGGGEHRSSPARGGAGGSIRAHRRGARRHRSVPGGAPGPHSPCRRRCGPARLLSPLLPSPCLNAPLGRDRAGSGRSRHRQIATRRRAAAAR